MKWIIIILLFLSGLIFIYRRTKFQDLKFLHYPAPRMIGSSNNQSNSFSTGSYKYLPQLSKYEQLSRKKINNYLYVFDDQHKVEVALVDLGYASVVQANYFFKEHTYSFQKQVSYSLAENFKDHSLEVNDKGVGHEFMFKSSEEKHKSGIITITEMHIKFFDESQSFIHFDLKHRMPANRCVTYLREGVVSYKCYGGDAQGVFQIEMKQEKQIYYSLWKRFQRQSSTAAFDGFRASGWQWQWVWGMAAGIKNGKHLSLNMGTINNIGEDVFHINDKIIPIKGVEYLVNQNSTVSDSFKLTSSNPQCSLQFKITAKDHKYEDLGILKLDIVKFEGYWSGYVIDLDTKQKHQFDSFPGLVETASSIF